MGTKHLLGLILVSVIFISGCATQSPKHERVESHATPDNVRHCFEDHADDSYEEALEHCQEDICGTDAHCFEEVEELSQNY